MSTISRKSIIVKLALGLVSLTTGTWVTFVLIIILAMLICFCTGLSLGVRRAVRQLENVVVPVTANSPKKRGSTPVLKDTPRAEPPTFTAVEKLTDDPRGLAEQSVDAPGAGAGRAASASTRSARPASEVRLSWAAWRSASVSGSGRSAP